MASAYLDILTLIGCLAPLGRGWFGFFFQRRFPRRFADWGAQAWAMAWLATTELRRAAAALAWMFANGSFKGKPRRPWPSHVGRWVAGFGWRFTRRRHRAFVGSHAAVVSFGQCRRASLLLLRRPLAEKARVGLRRFPRRVSAVHCIGRAIPRCLLKQV